MELQAIAARERQEAKTKAALKAKADAERCARVSLRSCLPHPNPGEVRALRYADLCSSNVEPVEHVEATSRMSQNSMSRNSM